MYFLGGHTITKAGWAGPRAVYVEFVSQYTSGWVWQLYAGRKRIGSTLVPADRRVVGQLIVDDAPAPLTVVRVDIANRLTDYGPQLPEMPWHRFLLQWSAASYPADTDRFIITASSAPGEAADANNVLAEPQFIGDGDYQLVLPPLPQSGAWTYRITPVDNALPDGNTGTPEDVTVTAEVPPADLAMQSDGNRFTAAVSGGVLTVSFGYGG